MLTSDDLSAFLLDTPKSGPLQLLRIKFTFALCQLILRTSNYVKDSRLKPYVFRLATNRLLFMMTFGKMHKCTPTVS